DPNHAVYRCDGVGSSGVANESPLLANRLYALGLEELAADTTQGRDHRRELRVGWFVEHRFGHAGGVTTPLTPASFLDLAVLKVCDRYVNRPWDIFGPEEGVTFGPL